MADSFHILCLSLPYILSHLCLKTLPPTPRPTLFLPYIALAFSLFPFSPYPFHLPFPILKNTVCLGLQGSVPPSPEKTILCYLVACLCPSVSCLLAQIPDPSHLFLPLCFTLLFIHPSSTFCHSNTNQQSLPCFPSLPFLFHSYLQ